MTTGPRQLQRFTRMPQYFSFHNLKTLKLVLNFGNFNSIFWVLSKGNWKQKLNQKKFLRGCLDEKKWSLITQISSLITYHWKYPNFLRWHVWHLFPTSDNSKNFTFCETHCLSTMSGSRLAYLHNTLAPKPFHLFFSLQPCFSQNFPFRPVSPKTLDKPGKGNPLSPNANLHLTQCRSPPSLSLQDHLQWAAAAPIC